MDQRLLKAARSGDINVIKQLADAERNILGGTTPQGNTALHMVARFGHENLVQEIMKRQPDLLLKSNLKGETPVHVAARGGHWRIVLLFRDSVHRDSVQGSNGVYIARIRDNYGNTPLHCAVRNDHYLVVWRLADKDRESLVLVNNAGESPLSIAIDLKLAVTAEAIIGLNRSTLEYRGPNGQTPLHCAVIRRDLHIMKKMHIRNPKLVKMQDDKQRTPLHYAAALGEYEIVKLLLEWDTSAAYQGDDNQQIPLHLAAENGQVNRLKILLDPCPDTIELLDNEQQNILHFAAKNGNIDAVSFILKLPEMEDLVNAADMYGNTPLHLAAKNFHSSIVYILTRNAKVDIRAINKSNETALAVVQSSDDRGMELQKHLTLKALKRSYAKRAINPNDVVDNEEFSYVEVGKVAERGGKKSREMAQIISVMATLIATFTFTAAFTIPGGFINNGPDEGMATLIRKSAFKAFVITDTIAMTSSMTAAVMVFWSSSRRNSESFMDTLPFAIGLTWISLVAMALAFVTGLFVVLAKTLWLGIVVCVIGCAAPAILYIFAPLFLLVFDRLSSTRARRPNIVEDNPFLFVFRLAKMIS
ncbi:protein ACCELERATED CELL DEATH 6-like [Durio zibethinus]|uniref:Protein ACCELERATED CELL DEATH 6-like n=1 Tax=Durio zibethinus TaxID=66656 RepID=A0A6P5XVF4_DURZI|nr:protein ACCELERATED CELL DEATH 6-like [Durio zibethinus]